MIKIISDKQLVTLSRESGFLINVDYPTKNVKLHNINCRYCDPRLKIGVKPSSKILNETGEFWYSNNQKEAIKKAIKIATDKDYTYSTCSICNP